MKFQYHPPGWYFDEDKTGTYDDEAHEFQLLMNLDDRGFGSRRTNFWIITDKLVHSYQNIEKCGVHFVYDHRSDKGMKRNLYAAFNIPPKTNPYQLEERGIPRGDMVEIEDPTL